MSRYEKWSQQRLISHVESLEEDIRSISTALNRLEQDARIEVALAKVESRLPETWATEYMNYATSEDGQYF